MIFQEIVSLDQEMDMHPCMECLSMNQLHALVSTLINSSPEPCMRRAIGYFRCHNFPAPSLPKSDPQFTEIAPSATTDDTHPDRHES